MGYRVSSFRRFSIECANLAGSLTGKSGPCSLGSPTCRRTSRLPSSHRRASAITSAYNLDILHFLSNKSCRRPAEDGRNCVNKHEPSRARYAIRRAGFSRPSVNNDADGVALPHLFTVRECTKHSCKAFGRGSANRNPVTRNPRKGVPCLLYISH